ncbi:MAG: methyltransferase [Saprospiraceae bacterium]|nr:methyltransferase [Saprospiraceae bacterium]
MSLPAFRFKKFSVEQEGAAQPLGTDAVLLGAWADVQGARRFLDIGTGTGVVALMIAQRLSGTPNWDGLGIEIHPPSAELARENFADSPWAERLDIWAGSIQEFAQNIADHYDLIVSNPPFFSELTTSPDKARSLSRHTASLSPGDLLACVSQLLTAEGKFCVILPEREGQRLCELAVPQGLYWTRITEVRSRPGKPVERLLLQFEKSPYDFERADISIYGGKTGEGYSGEFQEFTRDFYLGD